MHAVHRIRPPAAPRLPDAPAIGAPPLEDTAEWRELAISGADLSGGRVRALEVTDARFTDCNLANLTALKSSLTRCAFSGCRMTGFAWPEAAIDEVRFTDCLIDLAAFGFARLRRVTFEECILRDVDFRETRFDEVRFHGCDLSGAALGKARFQRSEMRGCNLDGLQGIEGLRGVALPWADLVGLAGTMADALGIRVIGEDN